MSLQEIIAGARQQLLANPNFSALIGNDVGQDPYGQAYNDGWVFKSSDSLDTPDRDPRNTGTSTVVLSAASSWTNPNRHNTLRFPELNVTILSDSTRGMDKSLLITKDADYRCDRVGQVIRDTFNDVGNQVHYWPNGLYVVSSLLWTDLRISYLPGQDGLATGDMSFALEIG